MVLNPTDAPRAIKYHRHSGTAEEACGIVEYFCAELFPTLPPDFVSSRLPFIADPQLYLAQLEGRTIAFKLAYRTNRTTLFSWLGGVLPEARRNGVASRLMLLQHEHARAEQYEEIETRTRTSNNAMLILNLRHGFEIVGLETDAIGRFVVIQRKLLR